jgi:DNA-binding NarL/FixJ family response regulator
VSDAQGAPRIRVLIVDDDVQARLGLRAVLASAPDIDVVGEADPGGEAVAAAGRLGADIVLMDVRLPGIGGNATTTGPDGEGNAPKVVVLTAFDFEEYALQSAQATQTGGGAFLLKRAPADGVIATVREVASGAIEAGTRSQAGPVGGLTFNPPITARERDVLRLVAHGLSNAEIGAELHLSVDTVKSHLKHIYAKSGVQDRGRLVAAAQHSSLGWSAV